MTSTVLKMASTGLKWVCTLVEALLQQVLLEQEQSEQVDLLQEHGLENRLKAYVQWFNNGLAKDDLYR